MTGTADADTASVRVVCYSTFTYLTRHARRPWPRKRLTEKEDPLTGTTTDSPLQSLAADLQRQLATKRDIKAQTYRASFNADPDDNTYRMTVDLDEGAEAFGVTRFAHQQVAELIGLPFKPYERLLVNHPDLLAHLANGLFTREPSRRLFRLLDGNLRACLSDRYMRRDNWDLLSHLIPIINGFPGVQFKEASLTETRMYVKLFLPSWEIQVTPKVGDVIRGGAIISNSEVGSGSLYIYPYTDRLSCLNGAVHTEFGQRRIHIGKRIDEGGEAYELYSDATLALDDAAFFAKCGDTLRAVLNESVFESIAQQMRDLAEIDMPGSPVEAVKDITVRHGLSQGEGDAMLRHLIEGGDLSAWGFVNGITATARDLGDADRRTELETLAGRIISKPELLVAAA